MVFVKTDFKYLIKDELILLASLNIFIFIGIFVFMFITYDARLHKVLEDLDVILSVSLLFAETFYAVHIIKLIVAKIRKEPND